MYCVLFFSILLCQLNCLDLDCFPVKIYEICIIFFVVQIHAATLTSKLFVGIVQRDDRENHEFKRKCIDNYISFCNCAEK